MKWKMFVAGAGLLVAGLVSQAQAAPPAMIPAPVTVPLSAGPITSSPLPGPGCASPGMPAAGASSANLPQAGAVAPNLPSPPTPGAPAPLTPGPGSSGPVASAPTTGAGAAAGAAAAGSAVAGGGGEGGSSSLASGSPAMIGDLGSRGVTIAANVTGPTRPLAARALVNAGAFKIAENESPRPVDRVFLTYNYFNDVNNFSNRSFDLHREVVGFEKTFLDGNASLGARLPFLQRSGGVGDNYIDGIGDLSIVTKFAFLNDRQTGDVVSGGVVVTLPTGRDQILGNGNNIQSVLLQPWLGFVRNYDRFYVHGFASVIIPTDSQDATIASTDIGVGYKLYQNPNSGSVITAVIPTLEAHLLTPLSKNGLSDALRGTSFVGVPDQLIVTAGVHFGLWDRAYLTFGAAAPVTGPRLFNYEAVVQLNVGF